MVILSRGRPHCSSAWRPRSFSFFHAKAAGSAVETGPEGSLSWGAGLEGGTSARSFILSFCKVCRRQHCNLIVHPAPFALLEATILRGKPPLCGVEPSSLSHHGVTFNMSNWVCVAPSCSVKVYIMKNAYPFLLQHLDSCATFISIRKGC